MNPNALVFWAFFGLVGFLIGGTHGAVIAVTIAVGVSFVAGLVTK